MRKFSAVCFTLLLHFAFAAGLIETGVAATQIASARAAHTLIG